MLSCLPWVHCDKHSTICIQLYIPSLKQKPVKQTSSHVSLEKRKGDRPHRYNLDLKNAFNYEIKQITAETESPYFSVHIL